VSIVERFLPRVTVIYPWEGMSRVIGLSDQQGRRRGIRLPTRMQLGWLMVVAGVVLLVIGWYEVSGLAIVAQQTPYLASASIPGAALLVAGAILVGGDSTSRRLARTERMVAELHGALLEEPGEHRTELPSRDADATFDADAVVAVPHGSTYHRPTCALVAGKAEAERVTSEDISRRKLRRCPVCDPPQV
jgi:hypothetical protein